MTTPHEPEAAVPAHDVAQLGRLLDAATSAAPVLAESAPGHRAGWLRAVADRLEAGGHRPRFPRAEGDPPAGGAAVRRAGTHRASSCGYSPRRSRSGTTCGRPSTTPTRTGAMGPRPDLRRVLARWARSRSARRATSRSRSPSPGGDTASALAAGCPVVLVAHPGHPRAVRDRRRDRSPRRCLAPAPRPVRSPWSRGVEAGRALIRDPRIPRARSPARSAAAAHCSTSPSPGRRRSRSTASSAASTPRS